MAPFDGIRDQVDFSCIKIGLLTSIKKKLNEEVQVIIDGKTVSVGVVEYEDEPWFSFKFDSDEQPFESDIEVMEMNNTERR